MRNLFYKDQRADKPKNTPYGDFRPVKSSSLHLTEPFSRTGIPEPIFDQDPRFVDFYWKAWEMAWNHIGTNTSVVQSPYMQEAFNPKKIWIWDTCFMAMYTKYAPQKYPGIQSLDNFYYPIHENRPIGLLIAHYDMPPLFAWAELEHAKITGDCSRLQKLINENGILIKHYEFISQSKRHWPLHPWCDRSVLAERVEDGFLWDALRTGMDNTLRGRPRFYHRLWWDMKGVEYRYPNLLWVDLLSQQALSALAIQESANLLGNQQLSDQFTKEYRQLVNLLNRYYWDELAGFYYDITRQLPHRKIRVTTPTSYWAMLAGACTNEQADRMCQKLKDPHILGGIVPWPSMARNERGFEPKGRYWRGGVWLPHVYMGTKALEKYHRYDLADRLAFQFVDLMEKTYRQFSPHTIWEAYSPTECKPSTGDENTNYVGQDFCGWSALGPVSLFIENVLGFHQINGLEKRISWRLYQPGRHGINNLQFGGIITTIIAQENGKDVEVSSSDAFTLEINQKPFPIKRGENKLHLT